MQRVVHCHQEYEQLWKRAMHRSGSFVEIAAILSLATVLSVIGQKLRQPLLIMFLATGILAGPACFGIIESYDQIELLATIGIALLLFIVGLKLDLHLIRTVGPVALATGTIQIVLTAAVGFAIASAFGATPINAAYIGVTLTFSSTIIIVKLLSDKKEIDSLHGQIAIGVLIVQDIAAILALVGLTSFGSQIGPDASLFWSAVAILAKGLGMLAAIALLMKYVLSNLIRRLSVSLELLTLFAIAWAIFLGAASEYLGFSKEVGAFLAGVSLASTGYRDAIGSRLTTLRDFLLLFFFIDLGARLEWSTVGSRVGASVTLALFVLIGKPLIVLSIMGIMGYRRRTGFLAGLTLAQISEFSLIVAALGLSIGHIDEQTMGLITLVGVLTIFVSTYLILYAGSFYRALADALRIFERRNPYREAAIDTALETPTVDVILVGLGNYGSGLLEYLLRRGKTVIGVDFDPHALEEWASRGVSVLYGDVADPELHEQLPLHKTRWVVSSVRSRDLDLALLEHLKNRGFKGKIAMAATNHLEAELLEKAGAHVVFRPFIDAAEQAADALTHAMDLLPDNVDWPIAFREVRIHSGAAFVGQAVRNIPLRSETGVSILAVSRAGRVNYDPDPDMHIYPGDRLVIMGPPEELTQAEALLRQSQEQDDDDKTDRMVVSEVGIAAVSALADQTLAETRFRQTHNVTVVGIRRGEEQITTPAPTQRLVGGDSLIVIGAADAVAELKKKEPL